MFCRLVMTLSPPWSGVTLAAELTNPTGHAALVPDRISPGCSRPLSVRQPAVPKTVTFANAFPASGHDPIARPFAVSKSGDTAEADTQHALLISPSARAAFARLG